MALSVLEVIDGSFCHKNNGRVEAARRVFHVSGLTAAASEQHTEAIGAIGVSTGSFYPGESDVNSALALAFQTNPLGAGQMRVAADYTIPVRNDFYVRIQKSTSFQPTQTKFLADGTPLRFPADGTFPETWVTGTLLLPVDQLEVTFIGNDDLPGVVEMSKGTVNAGYWQGKAAGFWLYQGAGVSQSPSVADKGFTMMFHGRNLIDWGEWQVRTNPNTGEPYNGASAAGINPNYQYGIQISTDGLVTKLGLHPTANFSALFDYYIGLAGG